MESKSIGKDAAIALYNSAWWIGKSAREIAEFQFLTDELCCPFDVFHQAVEETLGRSVWTHEFAMNSAGIRAEIFEGRYPPYFADILGLVPREKLLVVSAEESPC